jgi:glutathione S-transferase
MSIVFYWYPQSSASPIAAALAELQVPHERVKVDIRAGEQHRPEFLAINPNGKVPTLTVDGAPLFEGLAIQLWLGEQWGVERGLWPAAGTPQRLAAMSWSAWAYVSYGAVLWRLFHVGYGEEGQRDPSQAERALADLVVGSVIGYSTMLGARVAAHPKVQAWLGKVQARPAMQIDR